MKYFLHVLREDAGRDKRVFRDLRDAIAAACICIEHEGAHPEEILAEDGRVVLTHDQIGVEWSRRLSAGALKQREAHA